MIISYSITVKVLESVNLIFSYINYLRVFQDILWQITLYVPAQDFLIYLFYACPEISSNMLECTQART